MAESTTGGTSFFFALLLFPALLMNLIFLFYPLVVEGIIIGDRGIPVRELDLWVAYRYLGVFNRDVYVSFLLGFYSLSFLSGFLVAYALLGRMVRGLMANREIVVRERGLGFRLVADLVLPAYLVYFFFDRVFGYLLQDPRPVVTLGSGSMISIYILAGFWTGNALFKALITLRVFLKSRKEALRLRLASYQASVEGGKKGPRMVRWSFEKRTG